MTQVIPSLSLPGLQNRLDALAVGDQLTIAASDFTRLFGTNDVAHARLSHFARGHGCTTDVRGSSVTFTKAVPGGVLD